MVPKVSRTREDVEIFASLGVMSANANDTVYIVTRTFRSKTRSSADNCARICRRMSSPKRKTEASLAKAMCLAAATEVQLMLKVNESWGEGVLVERGVCKG